jgi:hypothetical protein
MQLLAKVFLYEVTQRKRYMKKLILVLAMAGLVAGCANDRDAGGGGDKDEMNSGSGMNNSPGRNMLDPWEYAPPGNSHG